MKIVLAVILSAVMILGFIQFAFADEVDPYDETEHSGYGLFGSGDDETEPLEDNTAETRSEQVSLSNKIFAGAVIVSCAGWITLIIVNKKKKQTAAEPVAEEMQVVL